MQLTYLVRMAYLDAALAVLMKDRDVLISNFLAFEAVKTLYILRKVI